MPGDISVVGFDDLFIASYTQPLLTTIRQPRHQMGQMAMEMLLKLFANEQVETNIVVSGELIVRESTAPPPERSA